MSKLRYTIFGVLLLSGLLFSESALAEDCAATDHYTEEQYVTQFSSVIKVIGQYSSNEVLFKAYVATLEGRFGKVPFTFDSFLVFSSNHDNGSRLLAFVNGSCVEGTIVLLPEAAVDIFGNDIKM